jgi:hypothetical protein
MPTNINYFIFKKSLKTAKNKKATKFYLGGLKENRLN